MFQLAFVLKCLHHLCGDPSLPSLSLTRKVRHMYFRVFIMAASCGCYWTRIPLIGLVFGPSHFFHSQRLLTWQQHTQEMSAVWCLVSQLCLVFPLGANPTLSFRHNTLLLSSRGFGDDSFLVFTVSLLLEGLKMMCTATRKTNKQQPVGMC